MSFVEQKPRPFSSSDIQSLNPNQNGVYGILSSGIWVYVGKGNIRERLLNHLNGDNPCITRENPTHWVAVITGDRDPSAREKELILELDPICNRRVG